MPSGLRVYRVPPTRHYPWIMPTSPVTSAPARPRAAAVVNAEIRRLAARALLTDGDRLRLAGLWAEWWRAVEAERDPG